MKTHINDLFDQMDKEEGNKPDDKIKIEYDPKVEELIQNLYKIGIFERKLTNYFQITQYLHNVSPQIYDATTITKLSLQLNKNSIPHRAEKEVGLYLNHLIQQSDDDQHLIHTNHHNVSLDYLGFCNEKNIIVHGNVGDNLGYCMLGGEITVNGNCNNQVGTSMAGGKITIYGNTERGVGMHMCDGDIEVNGEMNVGFGWNGCGTIYHNGKKVVENGQVLSKSIKW